MTAVTLDATVLSTPVQSSLDGERGITFEVRTVGDHAYEAVQVFLPVTHADQVDEVSLAVGADLLVHGRVRRGGVVVVDRLEPAPSRSDGLPPGGYVAVDLPVPDLARLRPGRERLYRTVLCGGIAAIIAVGLLDMLHAVPGAGALSMTLFLAVGVWLVASDLHWRRVDRREYAALAATLVATLRSEAGQDISLEEALTLLGASLVRTGNPWRPVRPARPTPVSLSGDRVLDIDQRPALQPGSTARVTVAAFYH